PQRHPAAPRRLPPSALASPHRPPRFLLLPPPFVPPRTGGRALGKRGGGHLGVPPRRRTDAQLPVLPLGTLGHLPPPQVTPQRDQQLPRQRHDADLPRPLIPRAEAALVPLAQAPRRLPAPPQPGQLHDQA